MNYLYPLNAIHRDGHVRLLYTEQNVIDFIRETGEFHDHHTYSTKYDSYLKRHVWILETRTHPWIVRDDRGRKVDYLHFRTKMDDEWRRNWRSKRLKEVRDAMDRGLPIPGQRHCSGGWKVNHTAKKNSGSGHRNRNRALAMEAERDYGVRNNIGRVQPWEGY